MCVCVWGGVCYSLCVHGTHEKSLALLLTWLVIQNSPTLPELGCGPMGLEAPCFLVA